MQAHLSNIKIWLSDFVNLFYPDICEVCETSLVSGEQVICMNCLADMPYTNYQNDSENPVFQLFWGKVKVEMATALFYFAKGSKYRKLLHKLKYKGKREIGVFLGRELGARINSSHFFKNIDFVLPVPLHASRLKQRGYNQSGEIAVGISQVTGIPVKTDAIVRSEATETQTRKTRDERWKNVSGKFIVSNFDELRNRHILLVDDVVTTGSTLEAIVETLLQVDGLKVSIAVIAKA
jgi:ComF family protein